VSYIKNGERSDWRKIATWSKTDRSERTRIDRPVEKPVEKQESHRLITFFPL